MPRASIAFHAFIQVKNANPVTLRLSEDSKTRLLTPILQSDGVDRFFNEGPIWIFLFLICGGVFFLSLGGQTQDIPRKWDEEAHTVERRSRTSGEDEAHKVGGRATRAKRGKPIVRSLGSFVTFSVAN